jgi:predicted amidophosphoribosyltransferase
LVSAARAARAAVDHALDLALPAACAGCKVEGPPLCAPCARSVDARLDAPPGAPIGLPADLPEPLLQLEWCAPFHGTVRSALHAIKYGGERRLAAPLGAAVARRWSRAGVGADILTNVPIHADRARQRGYDQAELIARAASVELGMPFVPMLVRARATIAQFDLDRTHRASNVAGAFATRPEVEHLVRGRWVLLVDDVVTTGATIAACASALETAGALAVSAIAVARER